jgi:hypothetical protein
MGLVIFHSTSLCSTHSTLSSGYTTQQPILPSPLALQNNQIPNLNTLRLEIPPPPHPHRARPLQQRHRLLTTTDHDQRDRMRARQARGRVLRVVEEGLNGRVVGVLLCFRRGLCARLFFCPRRLGGAGWGAVRVVKAHDDDEAQACGVGWVGGDVAEFCRK